MGKEKTTGFFFKMSPEECALMEKRMAQTGIRNKSAFIRKMCIDGHVFNLDMPTLTEIGRLLRITANNVNQIAKRVNGGGLAYRGDVAKVNSQLAELRVCFGEILASLTALTNPKPGKRFIPPPKVTDCIDTEQDA